MHAYFSRHQSSTLKMEHSVQTKRTVLFLCPICVPVVCAPCSIFRSVRQLVRIAILNQSNVRQASNFTEGVACRKL